MVVVDSRATVKDGRDGPNGLGTRKRALYARKRCDRRRLQVEASRRDIVEAWREALLAEHARSIHTRVARPLSLHLLLREGLQHDGEQQVHQAVRAEQRSAHVEWDHAVHWRDTAHFSVLIIL